MNLLLDSQLLIWTAREPNRLPGVARDLISDTDNGIFFSSASIWEIAIKHGRGRVDFSFNPHQLRFNLLAQNYEEVLVTGEHAAAVADLPPIHKDPFDRMLVVQATLEGLILLTSDRVLARYPGPIRRV